VRLTTTLVVSPWVDIARFDGAIRYIGALESGPSAPNREEHRRLRSEHARLRTRLLFGNEAQQLLPDEEGAFEAFLGVSGERLQLVWSGRWAELLSASRVVSALWAIFGEALSVELRDGTSSQPAAAVSPDTMLLLADFWSAFALGDFVGVSQLLGELTTRGFAIQDLDMAFALLPRRGEHGGISISAFDGCILGAVDRRVYRSPLDVVCSSSLCEEMMLAYGDILFAVRMQELANAGLLSGSDGRNGAQLMNRTLFRLSDLGTSLLRPGANCEGLLPAMPVGGAQAYVRARGRFTVFDPASRTVVAVEA